MNERSNPLTRDRLVRRIWLICFGMITGTYMYGVARSLFDGGSLPSALWLPDPVRREMFIGWAMAALVVALLALVITWVSWPRKQPT